MKLLIAIQNCFPHNESGLVFTLAWKKFLDKNKQKLDCDFIFMNNGLDQSLFGSSVAPYSSFKILTYSHQAAWDTDSSWWPFAIYHDQYTHIMRVDNDAFPTCEQLQSIITFLQENPDIDFVSASNFCRPISNSTDNQSFQLDTRACGLAGCSTWLWKPWMYPTHNSDLYIIKTNFFRKCVGAYQAILPMPQSPRTPFDTANLTYSQVCQILNHNLEEHKQFGQLRLRIDGSINTDFWTILCSLKPQMAGIVNFDNRSFRYKNHLLTYPDARQQGVSFSQVVDVLDIAWQHQTNMIAPYFHAGNAYVSECFFDPSSPHLNHPNTIQQFKDGHLSFALLHFCLVLLLARSCGIETILGKLQSVMEPWFVANKVDQEKIKIIYHDMTSFLNEPLNEYLDEEMVNKYLNVFNIIG